MDVGKKTESYQVRDKDFIAPGTASSRSFSILAKATLSITLAAVPGYTSFAGLHWSLGTAPRGPQSSRGIISAVTWLSTLSVYLHPGSESFLNWFGPSRIGLNMSSLCWSWRSSNWTSKSAEKDAVIPGPSSYNSDISVQKSPDLPCSSFGKAYSIHIPAGSYRLACPREVHPRDCTPRPPAVWCGVNSSGVNRRDSALCLRSDRPVYLD